MYGVEWLIVLGLLGLALGLGAGFLLGGTVGFGTRKKVLQEQLAQSQRELTEYRQEVVSQFSETARKFQTLNDAYTDLHQQLAHSSSVLCKDVSAPLLVAPSGHQDLIPEAVREQASDRAETADTAADDNAAEPPATGARPTVAGGATSAAAAAAVAGSTAETDTTADPDPGNRTETVWEDDDAIRVSEPAGRPASSATRAEAADASADTGGTPESAAEPDDEIPVATDAADSDGPEKSQLAANEPDVAPDRPATEADGESTDDVEHPSSATLAGAEDRPKVASVA